MNSTKEKLDKKKIQDIRKVLLPGYFGFKNLSQKRFSVLLSEVIKPVTGIDVSVALRTVQDWEHGKSSPSSTTEHVLEKIYDTLKSRKACPKTERETLPYWNDRFEDEYLPLMITKLTNDIKEHEKVKR